MYQIHERPWWPRFQLIEPVFEQYKRKFSVLDLGANAGYMGLAINWEFDSFVCFVDKDTIMVPGLARTSNVVVFHKNLSTGDLTELSYCERFDVVLSLNVLHHWGSEWQLAADAVLRMGDQVIVETPAMGDKGSCNYGVCEDLLFYLEGKRPTVLGWTPSHVTPGVNRPTLLLQGSKEPMTKAYVYAPPHTESGPVIITASDAEKRMSIPRKNEEREWIEGINLWTYLKMGGVYPPRVRVVEMLKEFKLPAERHGDVRPWNFILSGDRVHLIDGRDEKAKFDDVEGLRETIKHCEGRWGY